PQLAVRRQHGELLHSHLCTNIEQAAHQGALLLHDSPPATKLRESKHHAGTRSLSWLSRAVVSRQKITRLSPGSLQGDPISAEPQPHPGFPRRPAPCSQPPLHENPQPLGPRHPPLAPTARCAGTSDDRPDLPADDWTAPPITEPVAAAAIGS